MSNEELVAAIQAGNSGRMEELWEQVRNLVAWKAKRIMTTLHESSVIEIDDLIQSGYIAMVAAVDSYKPESGQFSTWLYYYLQSAFAETAGYRTAKMQKDPMKWAVSLDKPIGDDGDTTAGELVPDHSAAATLESVEESLWREQLREAEIRLLDDLPEAQRAVLHGFYFDGQSYQDCAATLGITIGRVRTLMANGIKELRRPYIRQQLRPFYEFDYYAGTGLTAFRQSGMSVQEKYLVRRETRTRAHRTAQK